MTIRVRFAPSPTGNIHIGNARPALINWLYAKQNGGEFLLRYDDTDTERSKQEYADGIARDLDWLGIKPHIVDKQSDRSEQHEAATLKLKQAGLLYPCYETPEQLDRQRKRQATRGKPPIYDRSALRLDDEQRKELEAEGLEPHWRFLRRAMGDVLRHAELPGDIWRQHAEILEAVIAGDPSRAEALIVAHDLEAAEALRSALAKRPATAAGN